MVITIATNEVLVERLPFFVEVSEIHELFTEYGYVVETSIHLYNSAEDDDKQRERLQEQGLKHYAIVSFSTSGEARNMKRTFHGHLFKGRRLLVSSATSPYCDDDDDDDTIEDSSPVVNRDIQENRVNFTYQSLDHLAEHAPKKCDSPSEIAMIRMLLTRGIEVIDVSICSCIPSIEGDKTSGSGFVLLPNADFSMSLCEQYPSIVDADTGLMFTFSHHTSLPFELS